MNKTSIEYLDLTWNPIAMRCSPVSRGCTNCWHLRMAHRLSKNSKIPMAKQVGYSGRIPYLDLEELWAPLRQKKPTRIGVQFMGDLFHESLSPEMIQDVLWNIQRCGWHKFFILTKRPDRLKEFFEGAPPLDNLWLGVSIEDQATANERIPILLQIPAAHRWVSCEPALGGVNLRGGNYGPDWLEGWDTETVASYDSRGECYPSPLQVQTEKIDWVVCGGETGPGARPMHPDWVRSVRDECQAAGVPFFFKCWGSCPYPHDSDISDWISAGYDPYQKNGGRLLDGRTWEEMPG